MSNKKKILFAYHSMIIGGSTTSLLALLNNLDPQKYDVYLQLYRNEGPLLDMIPKHVTLLPEAELHKGKKGKLSKLFKFIFSGDAFKYLAAKLTRNKYRASTILGDFQVKMLSRKQNDTYDYAIGFMEGWSDKYVAYNVSATVKHGWIHSTFSKIDPTAKEPLPWMHPMTRIAFVSDACRDAFCEQIPLAKDKAVTIENITDDSIIKARALEEVNDEKLEDLRVFEGLKLVTVCRVTVSVKGLDRIVSAAADLKKQGVPFIWYIIGDGEDTDLLSGMINDAGVDDVLVMIGKRLNPYPYLAAADLMCMPSRYEGKPMVVTEAMILGCVPVVTDYISAEGQIENGVEGVIVPNDDTSVIGALTDLSNDRERIKKMRETLLSRKYGNTEYIKEVEAKLFEQ
ncbi:MAG: glycosyltransferase [Clostridia bacterium]|nr:glycosyltransferase [Clostridia bacterium]